jgi:hypothetical protein
MTATLLTPRRRWLETSTMYVGIFQASVNVAFFLYIFVCIGRDAN